MPGTFKDLEDVVEARTKFKAELKAGTREVPALKPPKPPMICAPPNHPAGVAAQQAWPRSSGRASKRGLAAARQLLAAW